MISLRRQVMSIAALAVDAPASIRRIKSEHSRARLAELQEKANANSEELELARLFIEENETLKDELEKAKAESSRQAARAEAAENAIEVLKAGGSDTTLDEQPENDAAPKTGEVRYYKKTHSKPSYDVLVRISDCSHNSWQATNKADKAKKGIERVEGSS
jgi:thioesterase domain-containing protein